MNQEENKLNSFYWYTTSTLRDLSVELYEECYEEDGAVRQAQGERIIHKIDEINVLMGTFREQIGEIFKLNENC
jgi:hypothetical protein